MRIAFRKLWIVAALLTLAALTSLTPAYGHAVLLKSDPQSNAALSSSPPAVRLVFTEELEPSHSGLSVLDSVGKHVDAGDTRISLDNARIMTASLPELKPGVYTVAWRVLSTVDGHFTQGSFPFAVGSNISLTSEPSQEIVAAVPLVPLPLEAIVRWVNFLGQTTLVGAVFFRLFVWRPTLKRLASHQDESSGESILLSSQRLNAIIDFSILTLLAAAFATITIQAANTAGTLLEKIPVATLETLGTRFGLIWIARILLILVLALLFKIIFKRIGTGSDRSWVLALCVGAALLLTSSLVSHNAAFGGLLSLALVSDWVHLVAVSSWIGGLIAFALVLPAGWPAQPIERSRVLAVAIPHFSVMVMLSLGAIALTGLYSLLLQVGTLSALVSTSYGLTLVTKLAFIAPLVLLGASNQLMTHPRLLAALETVTRAVDRLIALQRRFRLSVRTEAAVGMAVLLTVGVLTSLPPAITVAQGPIPLVLKGQAEEVQFTFEVSPLQVGPNKFDMLLSDRQGRPLENIKQVILEFKFLDRNIGTTTAIAEPTDTGKYVVRGSYLSFAGGWQVEVLVRRTDAYDAITTFQLDVPSPPGLSGTPGVREFQLPGGVSPFALAFDSLGDLWFTEPGSAKIGRFDTSAFTFAEYPLPSSDALPVMLAFDQNGILWITDNGRNMIIKFDPRTSSFKEYRIPTVNSAPFAIAVGPQGEVWFTEQNAGKIGLFIPSNETFKEYGLPVRKTDGSEAKPFPLGIAVDSSGNVWSTVLYPIVISDIVMKLSPSEGTVMEFSAAAPIDFPSGITVGPEAMIWFAEHGTNRISRIDPSTGDIQQHIVANPAASPFGVAFDRRGNLWYAGHIGNTIGMFNVTSLTFQEYPIPTQASNTQWIAIDSSGNLWFAEASGGKLGVVTVTPSSSLEPVQSPLVSPEAVFFSQLVTVLAVATVVLTAASILFSRKRFSKTASMIDSS